MDALLMIGPTRDLTVFGLGQSETDDLVKVESDAQGRSIHAEDAPEKGFFFRSDHLNFARAGVPALYASTGVDLIDGGIEKGRALSADYVTNRYHKPADEERRRNPLPRHSCDGRNDEARSYAAAPLVFGSFDFCFGSAFFASAM